MNKIVFVGCGTGRCGTKSLSKAVGVCDGFVCTHELQPSLTWSFNKELYDARRVLFASYKHSIGDVGLWYLPYIGRLIEDLNIRAVCVERNKKETVESMKNNHSFSFNGTAINRIFPVISGENEYETYWDLYHDKAVELELLYPNNFRIFDIGVLNLKRIDEVLEFIGIPKAHRRYIDNYKYNEKV